MISIYCWLLTYRSCIYVLESWKFSNWFGFPIDLSFNSLTFALLSFIFEDEPGKQVRSAIGIKNTSKSYAAFKVRANVLNFHLRHIIVHCCIQISSMVGWNFTVCFISGLWVCMLASSYNFQNSFLPIIVYKIRLCCGYWSTVLTSYSSKQLHQKAASCVLLELYLPLERAS